MFFYDWFCHQGGEAKCNDAIQSKDRLYSTLTEIYKKAFDGFEYTDREAKAMADRAVIIAGDYFKHAEACEQNGREWREGLLATWAAQPAGMNLYAAAGWQALYTCREFLRNQPDPQLKAFAEKDQDVDACRAMLEELQKQDLSPYFRTDFCIKGLTPEERVRYAAILGMAMYTEYKTCKDRQIPGALTFDTCIIWAAAQVRAAQEIQTIPIPVPAQEERTAARQTREENDAECTKKQRRRESIRSAAFVGVSLGILNLVNPSFFAIGHSLHFLFKNALHQQRTLQAMVPSTRQLNVENKIPEKLCADSAISASRKTDASARENDDPIPKIEKQYNVHMK